MKTLHRLRLTFTVLSRARARTLLAAGAMAVGIAAVGLLFAVGAGAEKAFRASLENMGRNLISVSSGRKQADALRGSARRFQSLSLADWRSIRDEIDSVATAAPIVMDNFDLVYFGASVNMTVIGTSPEFQQSNNQQLATGRFIDEMDVKDRARVAVLGARAASELFRGEQALGERLLVGGKPYTVIGVLKEKGLDATGSKQDDRILVPVSTALRRLLLVDYVDRIFVQAASREEIDLAMREVSQLLFERHGREDFTVRHQATMIRGIDNNQRTLSRFLGGTAAMTLGLAGLGLFSVSLLSVRERRSEIGLRRAVGALPRHLLTQFLFETVAIAMLGVVAGLLVATIGITLGQWLIGWELALDAQSVFSTFAISLGLALTAGLAPASRAARMDPILALQGG
jgi:putative ABC transport system permease protein